MRESPEEGNLIIYNILRKGLRGNMEDGRCGERRAAPGLLLSLLDEVAVVSEQLDQMIFEAPFPLSHSIPESSESLVLPSTTSLKALKTAKHQLPAKLLLAPD